MKYIKNNYGTICYMIKSIFRQFILIELMDCACLECMSSICVFQFDLRVEGIGITILGVGDRDWRTRDGDRDYRTRGWGIGITTFGMVYRD